MYQYMHLAFSLELKCKTQYNEEAQNMLTDPGKKGGPEYANITLSKYPEHG
jgi:hypothetical protein